MNKYLYPLKTLTVALAAAAVGVFGTPTPVSAGQMQITNIPLFLGESVDPNVFFMMDDSGSMDWEILTRPYWHYCSYDSQYQGFSPNTSFQNGTCGGRLTDGLWRSLRYGENGPTGSPDYETFYYVFQNDDDAYDNDDCSDSRTSLEPCLEEGAPDAIDKDWRVRSSDFNVLYYNPDLDYEPWKGDCDSSGNACADASFTAAYSNPWIAGDGNSQHNLTGFVYEWWTDSRGFDGSTPRHGDDFNMTTSGNSEVDLWDEHKRITIGPSDNTSVVRVEDFKTKDFRDGLSSAELDYYDYMKQSGETTGHPAQFNYVRFCHSDLSGQTTDWYGRRVNCPDITNPSRGREINLARALAAHNDHINNVLSS
ncbi:MAG: hypothetical protein R3F37_02980 [Candidatus Competibacteraceae bacterium]